jgi:TolA-binding protein
VSYNLALIDFYAHRYDSSGARFRKLMVDYPRGYYVNDALRLVMLMTEAADNTGLLDDYSSALLFLERHLPDSARARLQQLVDHDNQALADVALFTLIDVHLSQADTTAALDAIERLVVEFEASYYAPFGIKRKADLLVARPEGVETARELYRRLLQDYPNYPFSSEVRKRLRELEVDRRIG